MNYIDFSRLFSRHGGYSLPVLIELKRPGVTSWYFTNNKFDIYKDKVTGSLTSINDPAIYKAVPMSFKFPTSTNGVPQGGTLEIDLDVHDENGHELLRWFDEADDKAYIEVTGLISEQGELTPVNHLTQRHGKVSWDGKKIVWNLGADDRLNMQVNPYQFDGDALTG